MILSDRLAGVDAWTLTQRVSSWRADRQKCRVLGGWLRLEQIIVCEGVRFHRRAFEVTSRHYTSLSVVIQFDRLSGVVLHTQSVIRALDVRPVKRGFDHLVAHSKAALAEQDPLALGQRFVELFEHLETLTSLSLDMARVRVHFERVRVDVMKLGAHNLQ